jgi:hypothetical protein
VDAALVSGRFSLLVIRGARGAHGVLNVRDALVATVTVAGFVSMLAVNWDGAIVAGFAHRHHADGIVCASAVA